MTENNIPSYHLKQKTILIGKEYILVILKNEKTMDSFQTCKQCISSTFFFIRHD